MTKKRKIILWCLSPFVILAIAVAAIEIFNPWLFREGLIYLDHVCHTGKTIDGVDASKADGIDVSHHNGWIDWGEVAKSQNIQFVYIKATQGVGYVDPMFRRNYRAAKRSGLNVGVYHFFTSKRTGERQFQHFKSTVGRNIGSIIPMVDVEQSGVGDMSPSDLQRELTSFCELMKKEYGRKPIIYTGARIYNKKLGGKFDSYYIWISRYGGMRPNIKSKGNINIWQYSEHGKLNGIDYYVDLNMFQNGMTISNLLF